MIPVHSILEVHADWTAFGFSYLSHAFGDGKQPKRMTYVPLRDARGLLVSYYFVPAEVL
jgi:hypothetical protein